ncbi:UNVERIFIED_CONTAM: hypothetical protein Slati_3686200 [Sesamum latifolium]|uniref:Reverse transcriptase n=1 Tax=Sesamum latifolium TaxID=2727402 RepID=A0AAW2U0Z3_9LAMI
MMFSRNTHASLQEELASVLDVKIGEAHLTYLGLPTTIGSSKKEAFEKIREKIWKKTMGWKERSLSQVGRTILVKNVLQAIPTYAMSCFRVPNSLLDTICSIIADFWWSNGEPKRTHWLSWNLLCNQKWKGGLGFRDMRCFNRALLAKQAWRIATETDCLLSRTIKAKYFPFSSFWEARKRSNASLSW